MCVSHYFAIYTARFWCSLEPRERERERERERVRPEQWAYFSSPLNILMWKDLWNMPEFYFKILFRSRSYRAGFVGEKFTVLMYSTSPYQQAGFFLLLFIRYSRAATSPGRNLPPGKTWYPFYRRVGGPQGRSGWAQYLVPTGIRSRIFHPVVSRYTDWANRPHT